MKTLLYGYQYSVYTRVVKFALREKRVPYSYIEVDPFSTEVDKSYLSIHPFQRVPALVNGDFSIYETSAITQYIDEVFSGVQLMPESVVERARIRQIISIVDAYAYWPMVRQVFSNRVFAPLTGEHVDEKAVWVGLKEAHKTLGILDQFISTNHYLCGSTLSLADIHLAPMIDYFQATTEGKSLLSEHDALSAWWRLISGNHNFISTRPDLSQLSV